MRVVITFPRGPEAFIFQDEIKNALAKKAITFSCAANSRGSSSKEKEAQRVFAQLVKNCRKTCYSFSLSSFYLSLSSQKLEGQEKSSHRIHDVHRSWGKKLKIDSNWQVRVLTLVQKICIRYVVG